MCRVLVHSTSTQHAHPHDSPVKEHQMILVFVLILILCGSGVVMAGATLLNAITTTPERPPWQGLLTVCAGMASGIGFSALIVGRSRAMHPANDLPERLAYHVPFAGERLIPWSAIWEWRIWAILTLGAILFLAWHLGEEAELPRPLHLWTHLRRATSPRWYRLTMLSILLGGLLIMSFAVIDTITYWKTTRPITQAVLHQGYPPGTLGVMVRDPATGQVWVHVAASCGINETTLLLHTQATGWEIQQTKHIGSGPLC
jgi:hypothetical protein